MAFVWIKQVLYQSSEQSVLDCNWVGQHQCWRGQRML